MILINVNRHLSLWSYEAPKVITSDSGPAWKSLFSSYLLSDYHHPLLPQRPGVLTLPNMAANLGLLPKHQESPSLKPSFSFSCSKHRHSQSTLFLPENTEKAR